MNKYLILIKNLIYFDQLLQINEIYYIFYNKEQNSNSGEGDNKDINNQNKDNTQNNGNY